MYKNNLIKIRNYDNYITHENFLSFALTLKDTAKRHLEGGQLESLKMAT